MDPRTASAIGPLVAMQVEVFAPPAVLLKDDTSRPACEDLSAKKCGTSQRSELYVTSAGEGLEGAITVG